MLNEKKNETKQKHESVIFRTRIRVINFTGRKDEHGEWRMENGEWRMESGERRMKNGEWGM